MNILIIQHFGGIGGGARSAIDVAQMLKNLNHKVDLMVGDVTNDYLNLIKEKGLNLIIHHPEFPIFNFHNASGSVLKTIYRFISTRKFLKDWDDYIKKNWNYDLVILNSSVLCPLVEVFHKSQIKSIVFIRETFRKNYILNNMEKIYLKKAEAVVYLTNFDKNAWNCAMNQFVIPDVVDPEMFPVDSLQPIQDNVKLLYLGGLNYYKGALDLLKALYGLKEMNFNYELYILGNTYDEYDNFSVLRKCISIKHIKYRKDCIEYINKINKDNKRIQLVGIVKDVSKYYRICNVIIFPVKKVHQPRPVYEAGYYGRTVVIPNYDNFKESIFNGYNGYTYKKNDIESFEKSLMEVFSNPDELEKRGQANKKLTIDNHSFENAIPILENILKMI